MAFSHGLQDFFLNGLLPCSSLVYFVHSILSYFLVFCIMVNIALWSLGLHHFSKASTYSLITSMGFLTVVNSFHISTNHCFAVYVVNKLFFSVMYHILYNCIHLLELTDAPSTLQHSHHCLLVSFSIVRIRLFHCFMAWIFIYCFE